MRRYLADTFAMVTFSTVCGAFVEIVIAKLTLEQSMKVRLEAIPIMLLAGRPYGLYRDWLFRRLGGADVGQFKAAIMDIFASVTFQIPLYAGLLVFSGARIGQMFAAIASVAFLNMVSGRPYGLFLVLCRKMFGLPRR